MLTSQEDIADALQISYMKAFAHIGELEHPESFEKWLKKIVINECRNYLRDNGKHIFSTVYIGGSYDDVEGSDLTVDIAGNEELRRTLDEILSSLPEKQRVCVNLFYYEKYSVTEIAALLGISEGTVKSRLHYGRRTLERKYKRSSEGKRFYGVTVPSKIGSSVVTAIGRGAFSGNTSLRSVSLPVGVKKIGQEAFADCTALTSVSLPSTLESVGAGAFYGCSSLGSVNIPGGVTSLGDDAFYGCSSLKTVTIPDSVTSIGDGAFDGCDGVTVKCSKDSAAYEYAVANGINVST